MVHKLYIEGPYGQIHCRTQHPAETRQPALVCLHMSPKSGRLFEAAMPPLARDRLVLAPDYPGMGESAPPPAEPAVTIEDYATAMWHVVDHLAKTPVYLLGHHTGAMVATEMATQRPDDVCGIVMVSAPVLTDDEIASMHQTYAPIPIDEDGTRYRVMWERILAHRGPGMTLEMAAVSMAENLRGGEDYEWGHRAAFNYAARYRDRLTTLRQPVLVLNPADDCETFSRRSDDLLQQGRRVDRPEWGHGFIDVAPGAFADAVYEFLEELEA
ncbi:MAG: alpha/beta fold hydrolase [Pseudomonadota bacterium]